MSGRDWTKKEMGRLAMRREGNFWVAYYALPNTMSRALLLGSIAMAGIVDHPERKQMFMDLMKEMVADLIESATGKRPEWQDPRPGPDSERSGNA